MSKRAANLRGALIFGSEAWFFNCELYPGSRIKTWKSYIDVPPRIAYKNEIVKKRAMRLDRFVSIVTVLYAPPQHKLQPPLKSRRFSTSLHWSDRRRRSRRSRINHRLRLTRISLGSHRTTLHCRTLPTIKLDREKCHGNSAVTCRFPSRHQSQRESPLDFWWTEGAVLIPILLSLYC